jgi:hypothetical protein
MPLHVPANKRMELTIALASARRDAEEGHFACSRFGEQRALAGYPRCSADQACALSGRPPDCRSIRVSSSSAWCSEVRKWASGSQ